MTAPTMKFTAPSTGRRFTVRVETVEKMTRRMAERMAAGEGVAAAVAAEAETYRARFPEDVTTDEAVDFVAACMVAAYQAVNGRAA